MKRLPARLPTGGPKRPWRDILSFDKEHNATLSCRHVVKAAEQERAGSKKMRCPCCAPYDPMKRALV